MNRLAEIGNTLTRISKDISASKNTLQARLGAVYITYLDEVVGLLVSGLADAGYDVNVSSVRGTRTLKATQTGQQSIITKPVRQPFTLTLRWDKDETSTFTWGFQPGPLNIDTSAKALNVTPKEIAEQILTVTLKGYV